MAVKHRIATYIIIMSVLYARVAVAQTRFNSIERHACPSWARGYNNGAGQIGIIIISIRVYCIGY